MDKLVKIMVVGKGHTSVFFTNGSMACSCQPSIGMFQHTYPVPNLRL